MPRGYGLSETVKDAIWRLRAEGLSDREIGRRLGLPRGSVSNHLARTGGIRPRARRRCRTGDNAFLTPAPRHLHFQTRLSRHAQGDNMLSDHPIQVVLLATDLQASRDFYAQKVGLEIVSENDNAVTFQSGGGTRLTVSASTTGTSDEQTQASWQVADLASELAELRSRGVEIVELDTPELKTENGIVDTGDALHAWFVDPGKNTLGIDQYK